MSDSTSQIVDLNTIKRNT
jgi:hypothetical protein